MRRGRRRQAAAENQEIQDRSPGGQIKQLPKSQIRNPMPPVGFVSEDQLEAIHQASLRVLSEMGVNFLLDEAKDILRDAGADVEANGDRVRFDPAFIEEKIKTVPSEFTLHSRNPAHQATMGGNHINLAVVGSPPNASDIEGGRRRGNFEDFSNFIRLAQSINVCALIGGYPVEPIDIHPNIRHLKALSEMARLCDKPLFLYSLGRQRVKDSIDIAKLAAGYDEETFQRQPLVHTIVNANSPLQYDKPMLAGVIELASRLQPVVFTPFTLAGAMAPVTMAGALVQQNAEALAGIAFSQCVRAGAPVVYGGFTSNVDMKTGAPAFGTPEYAKAVLVGGQLARRYGFPYRSSNVNASNAPDEQAVYESMMSLWPVFMSHTNYVKHAMGWLEGGLCASFEKVILDAEMIQMMKSFIEPMDTSEDALALDAMREVGPGGHFFGCAHTLGRYESAFYDPIVSDWRNFETWEEHGSNTAVQRAHEIYKQMLNEYEEPPFDPGNREAMEAFVAKRIEEGGAASEF